MFLRKHAALVLTFLLIVLPAVSGCSSNKGGYDSRAGEVQQVYSVSYATATDVRIVTIHGDKSSHQTIGGLIGSVAGGFLGSTIGSGTGRTLSSVGGALLGAAAGAGAGAVTSKEDGLQITLRYDDGHEEIVVQGAEPSIQPGQRVRIIIGADDSRRVEPAY